MAYQPKNYRKFVATAATATLVASAVAPLASAATVSDFTDVSATYQEAVQFLLDKGATIGKTETTFGTYENITRQDAAVQLVKVLGLEVDETITTTQFTDVPARTASYVQALVDAGITIGKTETTFGASDDIARVELAVWIQRGFELTGSGDMPFTDVASIYADAVSALYENGVTFGKTETTFGAYDQATRGEFALFLYRAANVEETVEIAVESVSAINGTITVTLAEAVEEVAVEDFTVTQSINEGEATDVTPSAAELSEDGKTVTLTVEEVAQADVQQSVVYTVNEVAAEAFVVEAEAVEIESVSAIGAKKIEVVFNTAVDVTADDFTVNKGTVQSNISSVAIAEDGKSAVIELTSKLTAGEYTVTVAQNNAEALTGSVTVEDEKVGAIEILSDVAPFSTDETTATVAVQILNQYGEDITKANAGDITVNTGGIASKGELATDGTLTLTLKDGAKEGDSAIITLVHGTTGVSAQKTVTLSAEATASEITFGELYNEDGKTLSQDTDLSVDKFYLPITVKDQYGEEFTTADVEQINEEILFTNTNSSVVTFVTEDDSTEPTVKVQTIDDVDTLVLEVATTNLAGTSELIAVSTTTGNNAKATVTVEAGVTFSSVTVSAPEGLVTANKDTYFPLTVVDSEGNEIKTLEELDAINQDLLTVNNNYSIVELDDAEGLYVEVPANQVQESNPITVVVTSTSGKVSTKTVTPKAEAVATVITGLSEDVQTALMDGNSGVTIANTDLVVEDQYGQVITDEDVLEELTFTAESSDESIISVNGNSEGDTSWTIAPEEDATKTSAKITFTLVDEDGAADDSSAFTKTFTIVSYSDFASYEVASIGTLYAGDAIYTRDFKVYGVTSSGNKVELDQATNYNVVMSSDLAISNGKIHVLENLIYNSSNTDGILDTDETDNTRPLTKDYNVKVVIGDDDATTLTTTVTISAEAPKVAAFGFTSDGSSTGTALTTLPISVGEIASHDTDSTPELDFTEVDKYVYFIDQYGQELKDSLGTSTQYITFSNVVDNSGGVTVPAIKNNGGSTAQVTGLEATDTLTLKLEVEGISKTIAVTITDSTDDSTNDSTNE